MSFNALLYTSLAIFGIGLLYKVFTWFFFKIGFQGHEATTGQRVGAAAAGIAGTVFSAKILTLLKVFFVDILLQIRILKTDALRWVMHMLMFWGFMLLLLMHAMDQLITVNLFGNYQSTVNPYLFLRDFFGAMVIAGVLIALYRRFILKVPRLKTSGMDVYAIAIVALILVSGLVLEGVKITSHSRFQSMVEDYGDPDDAEAVKALESLWVKDYGLVSPTVKGPFDPKVLAQGREVHADNCAECHSAPQWAFMGYATSRILKPAALALDRSGGPNFLWYLHILLCFAGLAYLPFSKMFHIVVTPISLLANAVMDEEHASPANVMTRQVMELDACTHCGTCSLYCSAMMAYEARGNAYILPSEKMTFLKALVRKKDLTSRQRSAIQEGVYLCTNCDRCTVVCPSGINLRQMWRKVREDLVQQGEAEPLVLSPFSLVRGLNREALPAKLYDRPLQKVRRALAGDFDKLMDPARPLSLEAAGNPSGKQPENETFAHCFGCQNCTSVCPVVQSYEDPTAHLGLLPHQIMCSLGMGLMEMASGARMLWDCVTCYQCQEHCPQNVKVADLLYELKNTAVKNWEKARTVEDSVPAGAA